jgi:hypothetical protein
MRVKTVRGFFRPLPAVFTLTTGYRSRYRVGLARPPCLLGHRAGGAETVAARPAALTQRQATKAPTVASYVIMDHHIYFLLSH